MKYNLILLVFLTISTATQANVADKKKLPPCFDTPNCVSSQAIDKLHYISPFKISGDPQQAWAALRKAILAHGRINITHETEDTLHAEAISLVLHFVDDVDAILDVENGLIHIRSASRVGHSDFGVNRKRMEALRSQLRKIHVLG